MLILQQVWDCPKMAYEVNKFISSCAQCQMAKDYLQKIIPSLGYPLRPDGPQQIMSFDITGPYENRMYTVTVIDHFTKFAWQQVVTEPPTSRVIADFLSHVFLNFGAPELLYSDTTTVNWGFEIAEITKLLNTYTQLIPAYSPKSLGICERIFRTLHNLIRAAVHNKGRQDMTNFKKISQIILASYNSVPHASTGWSPHFLMFGRQHSLHHSMHKFCKDSSTALQPNKYLAKIYEEVTQKLSEYYEHIRLYYNQTKSNTKQLTRDDICLVYFPKRQGKMTLLFRGPCRILDVNSPLCLVRYLLDNSKQVVHMSRILPYRYRAGQTRNFSAPQRPMGKTNCQSVQEYYEEQITKQRDKGHD